MGITADITEVVKAVNVSGNVFGVAVKEHQFDSFWTHLDIKEAKGSKFDTLLKVFDVCPVGPFPSVHYFLKALITLPMTTCNVERLFSSVQRIKSSRRTTMTTARLNSLCLLAFEKDLSDDLDYDAVIDIFKRKPRRLMLLDITHA